MSQAEVSARLSKVVRGAEQVAGELPADQAASFLEFCKAVARQLRPAYLTRYGAGEVPRQLVNLFRQAQGRAGDEIRVSVEDQGGGHAVVRTIMADQPFILDTVRLNITASGACYEAGFNAVVAGRSGLESVIQHEVSGVDNAEALAENLRSALRLARAMVRDFSSMTRAVEQASGALRRQAERDPANAENLKENADFLAWLLNDNFVLMGVARGAEKLGFETETGWAPPSAWSPGSLVVRKGQLDSPVHRQGRLDEIRVALDGEDALVIRGMFTFRAVNQASRTVPILRRTLAAILQKEESRPGSWRYKGIANVFDALPTEYLFGVSADDIAAMIERVLEAEAEQGVQAHVNQKADGLVFALVAMPQPSWSDKLREQLEGYLRGATGAAYSYFGVLVGRYETVLCHFYLTGGRSLSEGELAGLRDRLVQMTTPWEERFYDALVARHGDEVGDALAGAWGEAFDEAWRGRNSPERTLDDVAMLQGLSESRPVDAAVFVDAKGRVNLRVYQIGDVILSKTLPILDNMGLVITDGISDSVRPTGGAVLGIDTYRLEGVPGLADAQVLERAPLLVAAIRAVFTGQLLDDELNKLVLLADLNWREVDLLRACIGYSRQIGLKLPLARVREILVLHPKVAALIVAAFRARFDPAREPGRDAAAEAAREAVEDALRQVRGREEDQVLRTIHQVVQAMLRTNFYRGGRITHYISFKLSHDKLAILPEPRLKYEIYVHHPKVEGVHIRGGNVARGGIRWSDRSDFRTEILDLVRTQMVKNVVIVPEGSKGGFFLREVVEDPKIKRQMGDEYYKFLIRGMLDITDNFIDGKVIPPPDVVRHDHDDPYLVVAADKGTAHLSDTANKVAVNEYDFWLGDAFASGGSNGYDHKVEGITAKGGWECVKRHFAEMGIDPRKDVFTCVGVGDCGGDVFGNGVIEFDTMKLLAAFNHAHIFLDPNPDPKRTWVERKRCFDEVKGWGDYDQSLLSEGGGIFDRKAKSIPLSPQVKAMLGAVHDELPPEAVIRLILRMDVDLLWNGGIGTYVKASWQTHADAGDSSNDGLRVSANELRCKAVGEGGNLGFTMAARVEYSLNGGRMNTDFIDNSGGVDMSDHEVNIKILMAGLFRSGRFDVAGRNAYVRKLTADVGRAVLADNDAHGRQISIDQVRSARDPFRFGRAIQWIAEQGSPTAGVLGLPTDDELGRRAAGRKGLVRPELAVLSSHVKMHVFKKMKEQDASLIPDHEQRLLAYFPPDVQKDFPKEVAAHLLAKDILMTVVLTDVCADAGAAFFPAVMDLSGKGPAEVAGAFLRARAAFGVDALRTQIEGSGLPLDAQYRAWVPATDGLQGLVSSWLAPGEKAASAEEIDRTNRIVALLGEGRGKAEDERAAAALAELTGRGVSEALARKAIALSDLTLAREIALSAGKLNDRDAITWYIAVGQASRLLPALRIIESRTATGKWDPIALGILRTRYLHLLRGVIARTPVSAELIGLGVDRAAVRLSSGDMKKLSNTLDGVLASSPDVGGFLVAEERLRALVLG